MGECPSPCLQRGPRHLVPRESKFFSPKPYFFPAGFLEALRVLPMTVPATAPATVPATAATPPTAVAAVAPIPVASLPAIDFEDFDVLATLLAVAALVLAPAFAGALLPALAAGLEADEDLAFEVEDGLAAVFVAGAFFAGVEAEGLAVLAALGLAGFLDDCAERFFAGAAVASFERLASAAPAPDVPAALLPAVRRDCLPCPPDADADFVVLAMEPPSLGTVAAKRLLFQLVP